jgi:hypothetical protein
LDHVSLRSSAVINPDMEASDGQNDILLYTRKFREGLWPVILWDRFDFRHNPVFCVFSRMYCLCKSSQMDRQQITQGMWGRFNPSQILSELGVIKHSEEGSSVFQA